MAIMVVPADIESRVGAVIGSPFLAKGDAPTGWDCRGHVRWCLAQCGVAVPDYQDLYSASVVNQLSGRRERARLIAEGLAQSWRLIAPQAGAVAWLEWMGGAGHVGFMLSADRLSHADMRQGTVLLDLKDPAAGYRLRGAFTPSFISEIKQEVR